MAIEGWRRWLLVDNDRRVDMILCTTYIYFWGAVHRRIDCAHIIPCMCNAVIAQSISSNCHYSKLT